MADRTSAGIFAEIFEMLAEDPVTEKDKEKALDFWEKSGSYDFSAQQMCCNQALEKLGLARKRVDPKYPNDGPVWFYGPGPGS
jgi:hypothetical protein